MLRGNQRTTFVLQDDGACYFPVRAGVCVRWYVCVLLWRLVRFIELHLSPALWRHMLVVKGEVGNRQHQQIGVSLRRDLSVGVARRTAPMFLSSAPSRTRRAGTDAGPQLSDFDLRACVGVDDLCVSATVICGPGRKDEGPVLGTRRFGHACSIVLESKLSDGNLWNIRAALVLKVEDMHRATGVARPWLRHNGA